jgi:peptidyl-prolyl cis-trans isomerase D
MIRFLQTPGPIKKIVLSGMLLLICVAMLIYLIPTGSSGSMFGLGGLSQGVIADVLGEPVTTEEVNRTLDQMIKTQFPQAGSQANMLRPYFSQRALDQAINEKLMLAEAHRLGLRASDDELRDELQHGHYAPVFFPQGKFIGQDQYESLLNSHDLTVARFEAGVKDELTIDKLRGLIAGSATVSDLEVRREFAQRNLKVKFDYAVLTRDAIVKGIHPADTELSAYYEQNKARYANSIPEKRKLRYALIDTSKLEAKTQVTRDQLTSYYNQHREEFRVSDQVNVRHILIKTPPAGPDGKVDPKVVEEARTKAQSVLKELKSGAKFEDLAKKYSDDPGSKSNGGSLGWIGHGRTVPEFDKAAFALPKGGTSDPVQSTFGFHIIHVDDKQDAHLKSIDEVQAQIEPLIKQQLTAHEADREGRDLLTAARADGLGKAAAAKGLQVVSTDFVSRTDSLPGIGNAPQFADAAFAAAANAKPDVVQLAQGTAVYQVLAIKPPATPVFTEIRSRVETDFKNDRANSLLAQKTQELSDRAKTAHDLRKAAKEVGATVKTSDFVAPDGQVPDIGSMQGQASVAFTMKPGGISGPIEATGNGVVLSLVDRQEPNAADFAAKRDDIRDSLRVAKENQIFAVFLSNLHDQLQKAGKIKINPDEMKKLSGNSQGGNEGE